jgi:hypothetical protein
MSCKLKKHHRFPLIHLEASELHHENVSVPTALQHRSQNLWDQCVQGSLFCYLRKYGQLLSSTESRRQMLKVGCHGDAKIVYYAVIVDIINYSF